MTVNSSDGNILYVVTSNRVGIPQRFQQNLRGVFKLTIDGNNETVEEITGNLPADQAYLSIVHQGRDNDNPVYVGTNLGVYRIDDTLSEWEDYFTGFPSTAVSDLGHIPRRRIDYGINLRSRDMAISNSYSGSG